MLKKPCKFSHLPSPCLGFITNFKRLIESYLTNDDIIYMNVERARNTFELITAMQEKKVASTMQI